MRTWHRIFVAGICDYFYCMCLAPLNQHQQTDFVMSSVARSERLIARNIGNRH